MILWRVTRRIHAATPLNGEGSRLYGTRWSHPGRPLASASSTLSLAALEYLVHVDPRDLPDDFVSVRIAVPDSVHAHRLDRAQLPTTWRRYPAPDELAVIGDEWLSKQERLLLIVPSAIVPEEDNILVNPRHPDIGRLHIDAPTRFDFDKRLFAR